MTTSPAVVRDRLARPLRQLRISVTDRCNFRCTYCMPREKYEGHRYLPKEAILSFEEVERVARAFVRLGVQKLRLTGGEPLLRRDVSHLVERLAGLGVELAMTTNGTLLPKHAAGLRRAGLHRLTVSLDALDERAFQLLADAPGYGAADVLAGVRAAEAAGFGSVKLNCVVRRELSHLQIEPLVEHFRGSGHVVRFIEFMDVGMQNGWRADEVVTGAEILERVGRTHPFEAIGDGPSGVARRYRLLDGSLEFGLITSISQPFCGDCDRARLSADGQIFTCLFAARGHDLKHPLRQGLTDTELEQSLRAIWQAREDRYSELRSGLSGAPVDDEGALQRRRLPLAPRVEMPFIGG